MAKRATSSVALALLGCVLWAAVNAHIPQQWQQPSDPKGFPRRPIGNDPQTWSPTGGNPIGGNPSTWGSTGGNPIGGNPSTWGSTGGNPIGGNPSTWGSTGGNPIGGNPLTWGSTGGNPIGGNPHNPGNHPSGSQNPQNPATGPSLPQRPNLPPRDPDILPWPQHHHHHQHHHHQHPKFDFESDQQGSKVPQNPQVFTIPDPNLPVVQNCEVHHKVRIPCGPSGISAPGCAAINCCFDAGQCYYGKAVTVQCTKDGQFIVVVARDATLPRIDLESITLLGDGPNCKSVDSNSEFVIYNFPVTACGTVVREEPGVIIYENRMVSLYEVGVGPLGVITRDSHYQLLFQARYIGTAVETLVVDVSALNVPPEPVAAYGPIRVALRLANGVCSTKGCNEVDAAYTSFYSDADYPVTKILRDSVYVEVQLLEKTDPNLVLTLGRCWTTTTPTPHSLPQWDILVNGCPYTDDRYLSSLVPVTPSSVAGVFSHFRRFFFKMFTFVEPKTKKALSQQLYIHCSTAVCIARPGSSCEPTCFRKAKRDVEAVADQEKAESKVVVSVGPVEMSLQ